MAETRFDTFSRSLVAATETRRGSLGLFALGVAAMLAVRLGLSGEAAASKKERRRRPTGPWRGADTVQAEGKRRKKRKRRPPRPQLCDPLCEEDGGRCCPGRGCVFDEQCCPGEKACGDGTCVGLRQCCPGEFPCGDGSCPAPGRCCPEQHQCRDGSCVEPLDQCCPDQQRCGNGACIAGDQCCPEAPAPQCSGQCGAVVCEDGEKVCRPRHEGETCGGVGTGCCQGVCYANRCETGKHWDANLCRCQCDHVLECPPGQVFSHSTCSCVCNCAGRCCLSGCCVQGPGNSPYCCQGY